jgi:hypothetical protein
MWALLAPLLGPLLKVLAQWGLPVGAYVKGRMDQDVKADLRQARAEAEDLERVAKVQREQLEAQHDRPNSRDELVERLRRGGKI